MPPVEPTESHRLLHESLVAIVREHGPQPLEWLVPRARLERRDARIDEQSVIRVIESSTMLVPLIDGRIGWLADVLDGLVLTHRVRAPIADRTDLWGGVSLQPLLNLTAYGPIPLASGGEMTRMHSGEDVLIGPPGWLPDVRRWGIVGLRYAAGVIEVFAVDEETLPSPEEVQKVRELLADRYRRERWWSGEDDPSTRPAEIVRALTLARMEDPDLLSTPHPPLVELLQQPMEADRDQHHWREVAACQQEEFVSFYLEGVPVALDMELRARATKYGMSLDQYVIAVLGHLAWRTPFAEDMGPWDDWDPDVAGSTASLALIPPPPD